MRVTCPKCRTEIEAPENPCITIAVCMKCECTHLVLRIEDDDDLSMAAAVMDKLNFLGSNYIQAKEQEEAAEAGKITMPEAC